jgi:hypothetical protein
MLNTTLESQSRLIAHLLATYGGMVRNANESFAALAAMQAELAAAQARQASELWRRYFQLAQEAQLAALSSLQSHAPEATREAQAVTIDAAQRAIEEAATSPQAWDGVERRRSVIAMPLRVERRKVA